MMQVQHISKAYRERPILRDVSLTLVPGRSVILGGDNGSGKTTLLHIMMGLRHADEGQVVWCDKRLKNRLAWRQAREHWGFLPQQPILPALASVNSLLRFYARLRNKPIAHARRWLDRVGLSEVLHQRIDSLSGGMRQRLGIALVMFSQPKLIIMDEPTSSLDPQWRENLAQITHEQADRGAAILITSQLHQSWGTLAEYWHCQDGQIVQVDPDIAP